MNRNWGTFVLALMASVSVLLLRLQGSTTQVWLMAETSTVIFLALAVRILMNRSVQAWRESGSQARGRALLVVSGIFVVSLPWVSKLVQTRILGSNGEATELVWIGMLQYASIWSAAGAYQTRHEWLSFLISCFLTIFGLATSDREGMIQVVGPFAIVAAWWLMARYWHSIEAGFVASESVPLIRLRFVFLLGLFALAAGALWLVSSAGRETVLLDGFMPTSGGKQRADASARQGVGDGDMLVAARDEAFTFGPVDSDLFLESEVPSMYDLVSEIYGEASNKKRKYARAISLDEKIQDVDREGTESKKNSREFSALRKPKDRSPNFRPEGTDSRAVVQVIGRTPAWLRAETFDRFEEETWFQSQTLDLRARNSEPELQMVQDKPWMRLQSFSNELVYPVRERLAIKVIQFESPRLLSPTLISHVHIDRIDQPDFFGWMPDGQLMMPNREHVPRLTVVHQLTHTPSLHALRDPSHPMRYLSHSSTAHGGANDFLSHYLQVGEADRPSASVGKSWLQAEGLVSDSATDWDRVMAIVHGLRSKIQCDSSSLPPDDCEDVVAFLLDQGRGPDYLIATAAVLMVRELGIPCRLCRGFYARPERYDYQSGQTEVMPEDLHTWAEVYAHGMWLTIEPTGAYPMPPEHRTWQQWAIQTCWSIRDTVVRHPIAAASALGATAIAIYLRQRILEFLLSGLSALVQWLPAKVRIRWMLATLRWRMWIWGEPMMRGMTMERWLAEQLSIRSFSSPSEVEAFVRTVQGLAYAPFSVQQRTLSNHRRLVGRVCWSLIGAGLVGLMIPRRAAPPTPPSTFPSTT